MGSSRPKAALFVNAAASGRGRVGDAASILAKHFELAFHALPSAAALHNRAAFEARQGCQLVIAAGGDGTVNIVVNALAGTGAALGILPIGTANDFARHLGIPQNAEAAARCIIAGRTRRFDVIAVNGRRFCTVGGVGLATECALSANRLRSAGHPLRWMARGLGTAIYPIIAVSKILLGKPGACELNLTWTEPGSRQPAMKVQVPALFIANQRGMGGGLNLPVEACNDDGRFEICLVERASRFRLLRTGLALKLDRPVEPRVMAVHRAPCLRMESPQELGFFGDGELLCVGKHFDLEVLAGALAVVH